MICVKFSVKHSCCAYVLLFSESGYLPQTSNTALLCVLGRQPLDLLAHILFIRTHCPIGMLRARRSKDLSAVSGFAVMLP